MRLDHTTKGGLDCYCKSSDLPQDAECAIVHVVYKNLLTALLGFAGAALGVLTARRRSHALGAPVEHGTFKAYRYGGCRCDACAAAFQESREAAKAHQRELVKARVARLKAAGLCVKCGTRPVAVIEGKPSIWCTECRGKAIQQRRDKYAAHVVTGKCGYCDRPLFKSGRCYEHYTAWEAWQEQQAATGMCKRSGCDRAAFKQELCRKHYKKLLAKQRVRYRRRTAVCWCGKPEYKEGLCVEHFAVAQETVRGAGREPGQRRSKHGTMFMYMKGCRCEECQDVFDKSERRKALATIPHGAVGYHEHGCRCRVCIRARQEEIARDPSVPHGTMIGFDVHNCRCEACLAVAKALRRIHRDE